jgi:isopentenyl-diphosphate Delta-isomerase
VADISERKREHLELAVDIASQSEQTAGWEDIHLIASSLAASDLDEVDITVELGGVKLNAPFLIASMTGGHTQAIEVNERLANAAQELGVAIGSGSQRAALRDSKLARTYSVIREVAPDAVVMANVGICQLIDQGDEQALTQDEIETAVGMLDAQFLIVHLNVIEELIQPEGDSNLRGLLEGLEQTVSYSSVPVVAKETGAGMSRETAAALVATGVEILDVGGAGGTSFAKIEGQRAAKRGDHRGARLGQTFSSWGISTASSILEVAATGIPSIATGGVRTGLDAAKAICLGAAAAGLGRPILEAALREEEGPVEEMTNLIDELRIATLLTGCTSISELQSQSPVITGRTLAWATQRGLL